MQTKIRSALMFTVLSIAVPSFCEVAVAAEVRDRAVVSLTFDDVPESNAAVTADTAKAGKVTDSATLTRMPSRIPSAFVAGSQGYSLILDPARQQQVVIANSEDTSRPDAVSITGLFASMHPLNDTVFHGLFAKRKPGGGDHSNYGINFQPSGDIFQVYVNDGTGYKVAYFSVKSSIGFRRRVHLSACLDPGDAPGADADADVDDVRVRLFVNGQAATPTSAIGGLVEGTTGWLQDVSLAKCTSDTPFTIGSSFTDGEMMRLICDDIHLFAEALSDDDAKALFAEVTGPSAGEISQEQGGVSEAAQMVPAITSISPHSMQVGQKSRVTIGGQNLANARLHSEVHGLTASVVEGGNAGQGLFDIAVEPSVVPGRYLVRCVTPSGVSNPLIISVDNVATQPDGTFTEANAAIAFPVAVSGVISGTEQKRLWFKGTANQKIVAEVEAARVGSKLDPVVEIRSQTGAPLALQWQQTDLRGDARASVILPADGLYFAEVHDLQFRAPGGSVWRLIVGDLPPGSLAFPATVTSASTAVRTVGGDRISEAVSVKASAGQVTIESGTSLLPLPALLTDAGTQVTEPMEGTFPATPLDATFMTSPFPALLVNGRISVPKESDSILLTVTPGQTLHFSVAAKQLASPLRAHLTLFNGDAVVAQNDGESAASDPSFTFAVPDKVTQLRVQIRDLNNKGSAGSTYRLLVARTDRQAFVVTTKDSALRLPTNGSVPLQLSVVRQSPSFRYIGPIRLSVKGVAGVTVVPESIPASDQNQQVIVMLTRSASADAAGIAAGQSLTIDAKAEGAEPVFSTTAAIQLDTLPSGSLTLPDDSLVAGPADSVPAAIVMDGIPPVLLRGITTTLPVRVIPLTEQIPAFARFEMMSNEPARREDPNKPDSPLKPSVRLDEFQFGPVSQGTFPLTLRVPSDTPSSTIDALISVDFVPQPLAPASGSKSWTAPLMLFVDDAVTMMASAEPIKGAKTTTVNFTGSIRRHPLFTDAATVIVEGLPQGFTTTAATVPADQSTFTVSVTIPEAAAAGEVPNLALRVQHANGSLISKPTPVKLIVE